MTSTFSNESGPFRKLVYSILTPAIAVGVLYNVSVTQAEESTTNKVKDVVGDTKTKAKKAYRRVKREGRNAVGNDSFVKDIEDKIEDATDAIKNEAEKEIRNKK